MKHKLDEEEIVLKSCFTAKLLNTVMAIQCSKHSLEYEREEYKTRRITVMMQKGM